MNDNPVIVVNKDQIVSQVFQTNGNEDAEDKFTELMRAYNPTVDQETIDFSLDEGVFQPVGFTETICLVHPLPITPVGEMCELLQ